MHHIRLTRISLVLALVYLLGVVLLLLGDDAESFIFMLLLGFPFGLIFLDESWQAYGYTPFFIGVILNAILFYLIVGSIERYVRTRKTNASTH